MARGRKRKAAAAIDDTVVVPDGDPTIRWEFDNVSALSDTGATSKTIHIQGLPWYIKVNTETSDRTGHIKHLGPYLMCNDEVDDSLWKAEADCTLRLVNQTEGDHLLREFSTTFSSASTSWGFAQFVDWDVLLDADNGYVVDDKIVVEAFIEVQRVTGVRVPPKFAFTSPGGFGQDEVALVMGDERVYAGRHFLATLSPFFHTLFFANFAEKDEDEVELKDIDAEDFLELLHLIYPTGRAVNAYSYARLLALADRFSLQHVIDCVEDYLIRTTKVHEDAKLGVADKYRLERLMSHCISTFATLQDVKDVSESAEFETLSDATIRRLFTKTIELLQ